MRSRDQYIDQSEASITWEVGATVGTGAGVVGAGLNAVVGNLAWTVVEGLSKATGLVTGFSVSTWILKY